MNTKNIKHISYFKRTSRLALVCFAFMYFVFACIFSLSSQDALANNSQPKAAFYRYYNNNGVASVSRSVTPTHVRRGYDVLDRNMYLIKKVPPYNVEQDLRNEKNRAAQFERDRKDQQIKRSFRNVDYATRKKTEVLKVLNRQLRQQYELMKRLQLDRSKYLSTKSQLLMQRDPVPTSLQSNIQNNQAQIKTVRSSIENIKNTIADQTQYYDYVISRLQTM